MSNVYQEFKITIYSRNNNIFFMVYRCKLYMTQLGPNFIMGYTEINKLTFSEVCKQSKYFLKIIS
jgi:hypothetical protein